MSPEASDAIVHIVDGLLFGVGQSRKHSRGRCPGNPAVNVQKAHSVTGFFEFPKNLSQKAISHIRLNPSHPDTIFRVRVMGLNPRTTYYYTVDSMQVNGKSDGVKSPVNRFTTPD